MVIGIAYKPVARTVSKVFTDIELLRYRTYSYAEQEQSADMSATARQLTTGERVGENIRRARMQAGLDQRQTEELAGLIPTALSKVERGHRQLTFDEIVNLCRVLSVAANDLFAGTEAGTADADMTDIPVNVRSLLCRLVKEIRSPATSEKVC